MINIDGQQFGWLTGTADTENRRGTVMRRCVCKCGKERWVTYTNLRTGNTRSCGCLRRELFSARTGSLNPAWKGGHVNKGGYRVQFVNKRLVQEHRLVMEAHIGRSLRVEETVHHRNGIRTDNRLENLELWSSSHPPGQRVIDKLAWARWFIATYEPGRC